MSIVLVRHGHDGLVQVSRCHGLGLAKICLGLSPVIKDRIVEGPNGLDRDLDVAM